MIYYIFGFIIATTIYALIVFLLWQLGFVPRGVGWFAGWIALVGACAKITKGIVEKGSIETEKTRKLRRKVVKLFFKVKRFFGFYFPFVSKIKKSLLPFFILIFIVLICVTVFGYCCEIVEFNKNFK